MAIQGLAVQGLAVHAGRRAVVRAGAVCTVVLLGVAALNASALIGHDYRATPPVVPAAPALTALANPIAKRASSLPPPIVRKKAPVAGGAGGPERKKKHGNSSSIIKLEQALWAELDAQLREDTANISTWTANRFRPIERFPYGEQLAKPPQRMHPVLGRLHSQFSQEQLLFDRYAQGIPHTFVEFGCRNGIKHSNTYSLEKIGWKGLCIEAIETISASRRNRHQGAVCDPKREGEEVTFDISLPGLHGVQGTTDFAKFGVKAKRKRTQRVRCLSLPRLLDASNLLHIGYMTVDLEGGEIGFLRHFDFRRYRVDVLQVECNSWAICDETSRYVETLGFRCVFKHKFGYPCCGAGDLLFENRMLRPDDGGGGGKARQRAANPDRDKGGQQGYSFFRGVQNSLS